MQRKNERFVERLPLVLDRPVFAYVLTLVFCVAALMLRMGVNGLMPSGYPFVTFFPAVILSSFLFGVRPGISAAVSCGLMAWYFFIAPVYSLVFNPGVAVAMTFYIGVVVVDILLIHFMQRANFRLAVERERSRALAEHRELLFHELQHRVSNNLQVVAAMLALQRRHIDHDVARRALDDAAGRLALVGKISRALYDPSGSGKDLGAFLDSLARDVVEATGRDDISLMVEAPPGHRMNADSSVPLALIVAEAVSNAIEHGLPDRAGRIDIVLRHDAEGLKLRICDDGRGLPDDFVAGQGGSLGLRFAGALAEQLGGHFALEPRAEGGASARLDLPG